MRGVLPRLLGLGGWFCALLVVSAPSWGQAGAEASCTDALSAEPAAVSALALDPREVDALRLFYQGRDNRCGWSDGNLAALRSALSRADDQGLDPARYRPDAIDAVGGASPAAARDLIATALALRYGHDMVFGRVDLAKIAAEIDVPRPREDLAFELGKALAQPDIGPWLSSLIPSDPAYRRLIQAFHRYRDRSDETDPVAAGRVLKVGDSDARVVALKARLRRLGDLQDDTAGPIFDAPTKTALAAFQRRHGLAEDGRLNRETLAALNVPDRDRLRRIELNLERWRYFGHVLAATRIEVNTAAATARLIEHDRVVLAMRAIVGDRKHASPMLVSPAVESIILNPTWYVPESIVKKEIEPHLERDPDYLDHNDMHWADGRLLQSPGARNALGRIKFDFPSSFAVYLHDTPSHALFATQDRALSHGCIRLEQPRDLAAALLTGQPEWTPARFKTAIDGGTSLKIVVSDGPQVALVYWTAFVDEDGTVEFRDDLYGHDARLQAALDRANSPAGAPDSVSITADRRRHG
jgi:murein L,D-transpeptidase YcbB/YkuD